MPDTHPCTGRSAGSRWWHRPASVAAAEGRAGCSEERGVGMLEDMDTHNTHVWLLPLLHHPSSSSCARCS
eukprot:1138894-Pelagomonas_calceolata.AAC.8